MEGHRHTSTLEQKVDDILDIVVFLKDSMGEQFAAVNSRLDRLELRMDVLENRIGVLESRMDSLEGRINSLEQRIDALESRMDYFGQELKERVTRIEDKVDIINRRSLEDANSMAKVLALHEIRISRLEKQQQ